MIENTQAIGFRDSSQFKREERFMLRLELTFTYHALLMMMSLQSET